MRDTGDDPGLAIRLRGLTKRFGDLVAVDGVDLDIPKGQIFAILGPNGAGKTTLIRMLATLIAPDGGTARIAGHNLMSEPERVRSVIALTGQYASLDEDLTGRENLILLARLWGFSHRESRARAGDLLTAFDLADAGQRQVQSYSGGMRRRLDIAASLVVTPAVLFLDEPTTGLDPAARQKVWRLIRSLAGAGVTVVLTTQYLEEADQLAGRIAVIDHGRKIAEGTSRELKAQVGAGFLTVTLSDPAGLANAKDILASTLGHEVHRNAEDSRLSVMAGSPAEATAAVSALIEAGLEPADFALGAPSLEEVFFALTGRAPEDAE
ncbi:ATP-binding cassette domain-containing protein [Ovoidimarina sediminis]|uniref:ATP-binding cassette domain-containing protein n=1 Tax=Ovoidimarina sediminis TaxID=3079856 RepID=UPI00290DEB68|nr:ATP-binding cassette domain-containing protein [Rhodophyticola sp. MJ-SS7]MDU8944653.1 ATP-binding cassette domain-containing protein [Rhodophyticola sp. MJ-SS7]